jgi:hypothetical protein
MDSNVATGLALVELFTVVLWLWAFVSMLLLPSQAYEDAGKSKALWALLLLAALFLPVIGLILCMWFIFSTSTQVRAERQLDEHVGFPGGPPQY